MRVFAILTLALCGAVVAVAAPMDGATPVSPAAPLSETMVAVPLEQASGVGYMNGGASLEQMTFMKAHASEFSAQILFSGRGGEYGVADAVTVIEGERALLTIPNAGPMLMLQLPPGRYVFEARFARGVERRSVVIGKGETKLNWNTPKASD